MVRTLPRKSEKLEKTYVFRRFRGKELTILADPHITVKTSVICVNKTVKIKKSANHKQILIN